MVVIVLYLTVSVSHSQTEEREEEGSAWYYTPEFMAIIGIIIIFLFPLVCKYPKGFSGFLRSFVCHHLSSSLNFYERSNLVTKVKPPDVRTQCFRMGGHHHDLDCTNYLLKMRLKNVAFVQLIWFFILGGVICFWGGIWLLGAIFMVVLMAKNYCVNAEADKSELE